jgi:hypothetical protein
VVVHVVAFRIGTGNSIDESGGNCVVVDQLSSRLRAHDFRWKFRVAVLEYAFDLGGVFEMEGQLISCGSVVKYFSRIGQTILLL